MHTHNSFLTLTYNEEHLPKEGNLLHDHFQLFIKRLREAALQEDEHNPTVLHRRHIPNGCHEQRAIVRYHMCGEYGPMTGRPHYHANLFGVNFADKTIYKKTPAGSQLYISKTLDKLWALGQCTIGHLTWQTAAYTARYNMKKAGEKNKNEIINPETGEVIKRTPEYQKMSRNPGIGGNWIEKYITDVYPRGTVIVSASEVTAPRFYDERYKRLDENAYNELKLRRQHEQAKRPVDITTSTQRQGEIVARAKLAFLKRNAQ